MQISVCARDGPFSMPNRLGTVIGKLGVEFIEFTHVLQSFPVPILLTTPEANIVYVNHAWEKLTGYELKEVEGKNPRLLKSGKTDKRLYVKMWSALTHGKAFSTEGIVNRRKDGHDFYTNSIIFPIQQKGEAVFYVQLEIDITNKKKLDELKKEFLATATHELKTPITTLRLLIQSQVRKMVKKQYEQIRLADLQLIQRELDRLTSIVEDLSDVTRLDSGKMRIDLEELNITALIKDVVLQMRTVADGHEIRHTIQSPLFVQADGNRIKQVLINLLKNALKFSYPKSQILVSADNIGAHCIVSVSNLGDSIPQELQSHIFDRFYQLRSNHNAGLGLGLYISKKIIQQHKGQLTVTSSSGNPTVFSFSLHLA